MALQGKLVRDKIPEMIRCEGVEPVTYTAPPAEYSHRLRAKLLEEAAEFVNADKEEMNEELADVLEVVHALALDLEISPQELEDLRSQKALRRGGFASRTVWTGNR